MRPEGERKRILITGAAGQVGRGIRPYLRGRYDLLLMRHSEGIEPEEGEEVVAGDVLELQSVAAAMNDADAVIHLAAIPDDRASWEQVRLLHIDGVYNVLEAARREGVKKVVFASTNHVTGWYEREGVYTRPDMPVRPDGYYGATKAFGEALGRYYADEFGLSVVCLRIGTFRPEPDSVRSLATWLSPRDCAQLIWRSIETDIPFGIYYGISGNTRRYWDITSAQLGLGYEPEDNAETYASQLLR